MKRNATKLLRVIAAMFAISMSTLPTLPITFGKHCRMRTNASCAEHYVQ